MAILSVEKLKCINIHYQKGRSLRIHHPHNLIHNVHVYYHHSSLRQNQYNLSYLRFNPLADYQGFFLNF